jgi:hypothetical protein
MHEPAWNIGSMGSCAKLRCILHRRRNCGRVCDGGRETLGRGKGKGVSPCAHPPPHTRTTHKQKHKMIRRSGTAALSALLSAAVSLSLVKTALAAAESLTNTVTV